MTTSLRAIETNYKGYRFRSRLEARWAVFFETLGVEYKYEPEGFSKSFGDLYPGDDPPTNPVRYLPDFYLPKTETWVEVKGSDEQFQADAARMESFLDWGCPLVGFDDSDDTKQYGKVHGLLVLGDIPDPTKWGIHLHPIIRHYKGLRQRYAWFLPTDRFGMCLEVAEEQTINILTCIASDDLKADNELWTTRSVFCPTQRAFAPVIEAYRAARSTRFEHGETP